MIQQDKITTEPDSTAVRVALWRALHVQTDPPPHIIEDEIGFRLAAPDEGWQQRPDMNADATKPMRASIVARARFIEELAIEQSSEGIDQYVILGAGLDSFAQRKPEVASRMQVFEIDQPGTQAWKKQRLTELGFGVPDWLHFVPVNFEAGASWWEQLKLAGFNPDKPAVVSCTGVSLYLTKEANFATLQQVATFAPGSTLAMTFILPAALIDAQDRSMQQTSEKGASASGTPFISFFSPDEMLSMAREAGFKKATIVSGLDLGKRFFSGRTDAFFPSNAEQFLVANT